MPISAADLIAYFQLRPLNIEGGYYRETYRSADHLPAAGLPGRYQTEKSACTAIYYLLTPETFSVLHRLPTDEIFHFYLGDSVEMLLLHPDGNGREVVLGSDFRGGQELQFVVPRGVWQGCRLRAGGRFALLGVTVAPGFDFSDFEAGRRDDLLKSHPRYAEPIALLTHP
jgi:predicted cupin superfamily sugar epimerase